MPFERGDQHKPYSVVVTTHAFPLDGEGVRGDAVHQQTFMRPRRVGSTMAMPLCISFDSLVRLVFIDSLLFLAQNRLGQEALLAQTYPHMNEEVLNVVERITVPDQGPTL